MDPDSYCDLTGAAGYALLGVALLRRSQVAGASDQADTLEAVANDLQNLAAGQAPTAPAAPHPAAAAPPATPPQPAPQPPRPGRPPRR